MLSGRSIVLVKLSTKRNRFDQTVQDRFADSENCRPTGHGVTIGTQITNVELLTADGTVEQ